VRFNFLAAGILMKNLFGMRVGAPRRVRRLLKSFLGNMRGSVSPLFGLAAIPMLAVVGVALDYNRYVDAEVNLQAIADAAALAGAAKVGTAESQKLVSQTYLAASEMNVLGLSYSSDVTTPTRQVQVTLSGHLDGTFLPVAINLGAPGSDAVSNGGNIDFTVVARANYLATSGGKVCMLTLNASAQNAMYFSGNGNITATNCGFQSNSNHATQSLHLQGSAVATADFFKSVGGWDITGNAASFSTPPESNAAVFTDPFLLNPTCPSAAGSDVTASARTEAAADAAQLTASVYRNITVRNGRYASFSPGIHYIKGSIDMTGGKLKGNGVTLVMCGPSARINMNGGDLALTAPTTGTYAGFAIIGNSTATTRHELQGGAATFIRGIMYTPKAGVRISGNSDFNTNSSYFPLIADNVTLTGSGTVNIGVDYAAYGFAEPTELNLPGTYTVWLDR
jgi:Flp pilus assembly protein TadG